jgi:hypothetical protein
LTTTGGQGRRPVPVHRSVSRRGTSYGRSFEIIAPAVLLPAVTARLVGATWDVESAATPETSWRLQHLPGAGWQASRDGRALSRAEGPDEAVERLVSGVERWIAAEATEAVFVDAGVVGWRGRALVLPGRRLPGRTTLVAHLVRAGAAYLSDVFAVLDEGGRVHAYPRPMAIGPPEWGVRQRRLAPAPPAGSPPLPVGMIARLAYHPGGAWTERLTRGQATLALIDAAVTGPARGDEVARIAAAAARDALAVAGHRGEAGETARMLLAQLDEASGHTSAHEARRATHSSSRIEWTTESRQAPRTKT